MNTTITRRELITHELKWYWKKPELRKIIRDFAEAGEIEHAPLSAKLPELDEEQLDAVLMHDIDALICKAMAEYDSSELYSLYRYVFLGDMAHATRSEMSPLTIKLGHYVLPYVGVMAVYAMADRMVSAAHKGLLELSIDADLWLRQLRFQAARRLHVFTKNLTRLNADNSPSYGVCTTSDHVAQIYLRGDMASVDDITTAEQAYPGNIPNVFIRAEARPTRIEFDTHVTHAKVWSDCNRPAASNLI